MAKRKTVTLVAPNGNEHTLSDPVEAVNLKARGYVEKKAAAKQAVQFDKAVTPQNK